MPKLAVKSKQYRDYTVSWSIELSAENFQDAAEKALKIQRAEQSIATVFIVEDNQTGISEQIDIVKGEE